MLMKRLLRAVPLLAPALALCGCATPPPTSSSPPGLRQNLQAHVAFLCRPDLKGRKAGTRGARVAAQYVERCYAAQGLLPWGEEKDYALPFGYGRNIVGVLPGSDPALKDEIVLVSAHYDHLGRVGNRVHPGASDNAAGVAALLETVRVLTTDDQRPKRSIAFAAFDSEEQMLLGSFAFSVRPDVQAARIVAVINADILGRAFMDVVTNTLFVAGTEDYPALRSAVKQFGTSSGIRVLPLGTDLIGPRSDHVAFELRGVPCLFFTCGTCRDYHQPTDTPEKLDYTDLESSARTILATVQHMANAPALPSKNVDSPAFAQVAIREELQTVQTIMTEVDADHSKAGVTPEDTEAFARLQKHARVLLETGKYDREARMKLASEATGLLAPYFLAFGEEGKPKSLAQQQQLSGGLRCVQLFYLMHKAEVLQGYRALVAQVLKDRPGLFRSMRPMQCRLYFIDDQDIAVSRQPDGNYTLGALGHWLNLAAGSTSTKWLIKGFGASISLGFDGFCCEGTRDELEDFCLLHLRSRQADLVARGDTQKLLDAVEAPSAGMPWFQAIAHRLKRGGFADEQSWIANCIGSANAKLALTAIATGGRWGPRVRTALCKTITDRQKRGDVRAAAIRAAARVANRDVVRALCVVVDDDTSALSEDPNPVLSENYPFADRPWVQAIRPFVQQQPTHDPKSPKTIGLLARAHLTKLSKRDYGADPAVWCNWADSAEVQISRMASSSP